MTGSMNDKPNSYEQICPVAFALDVVGAKWTPIILRDLARASLRFTDLRAINPTMSPSLLSTRLKQLESAGIIERRIERGPAKTARYALTDSARPSVVQLLSALAALGSHVIEQDPPEGDLAEALAMQMNLNGHFVMARESDLAGYFVFDMSGPLTHVVIDDNFAATVEPPPGREPDATAMFFPPTTLMRIMGRAQTLAEAEELGLVSVTGDRPAMVELIGLLSFE